MTHPYQTLSHLRTRFTLAPVSTALSTSQATGISAITESNPINFVHAITGLVCKSVPSVFLLVEGSKSPEQMLTLLQRVLEESSTVLVAARLEAEERLNNVRLWEEQDAAYQAALEADQVSFYLKYEFLTNPGHRQRSRPQRYEFLALKYGLRWKHRACRTGNSEIAAFEMGSWVTELVLSACSQSIRS